MVQITQGQGLSRRRVVFGATAFAATAVGAAACAPGNTTQSAPTANVLANQKNATLEAWVHADTRSAWQMKTLEDYNKEKGANVTINWVKLANTSDLANKLVVTTAAGSGFPDLADVEISQMGKLLKTPTPPLVAFNDHLKGKENDFFKPSFVDPWSLNGKYYGLGNELNVCLFAYRHDLFDRAGIKAPIKTWDEVVDVGKRLAPHAPFGAFLVSTGTTNTFHTLAIPAGGGYLEKGSKLTVNHTGNVKALQYLQDLVHRHKAAALEPSSEERKDAWTNAKVGGELGPSWRISGSIRTDAPESEGKWMVQHYPQWSASGPKLSTSRGGTGMTVLKESKFKDIGIDFLIWEHSTKAVLRDFELRQVWPTNKKVYDDPRLTEPIPWFNNQRVGQIIKEAAETMLPFHQGVWWPEISTGAGKHISAALKNEKPVRQALDEAQQEARAAIEAAGGRIDPDGTIRS